MTSCSVKISGFCDLSYVDEFHCFLGWVFALEAALTRAPTGVWANFAPTGGGRMTAPPEISKTKQRSEKRQTAFECLGGLQKVLQSFFRQGKK